VPAPVEPMTAVPAPVEPIPAEPLPVEPLPVEPLPPSASIVGGLRRSFLTIQATLAILLLVGLGSLGGVLESYHPKIQQLSLAADGVRDAHAGLLDQETGLRGFLLTQKTEFLKPYYKGQGEVSVGNATLLDAGSDRKLVDEILNVRVAEQAWITGWADRANHPPVPGDGSPAALVAFLLQGKALFDHYRVEYAVLADEIDNRRAAAISDERTALIAALGIEALVAAVAFSVTIRQRRRLASLLVQPVQDLLDVMRRIGAGDLTARARSGGAAEVSEVAEIAGGLSHMAGQLAESRDALLAREAEVADQAAKLSLILELTKEIGGSLSLRYVLDSVAQAVQRVSGAPVVRLWLAEEDGLRLAKDSASTLHVPPDLRPADHVTESAAYGQTVRPDGSDSGALAVPMVFGGRVVGVIDLPASDTTSDDEATVLVTETLATHAASAIDAARLHLATETLSRTDALTRLPNRRQLDTDLATECHRSQRYGRPLAFIMLDVDHFKDFNDSHGHQRGDEVLAQLGQLLAESVRTSDSAYRYGGEEFAILIREANVDAAQELAERIRQRIVRRFASYAEVTASFGVTGSDQVDIVPEALIRGADSALFAAKNAGRNRVVLYDPHSMLLVGARGPVQSADADADAGGPGPSADEAVPPADAVDPDDVDAAIRSAATAS
jgi:diguanylate cyclase (GGDEF)-like protein